VISSYNRKIDFVAVTKGPFRAQRSPAHQDLCSLQARLRLAKEVGARLGKGEVLLKNVCSGSKAREPRIEAAARTPVGALELLLVATCCSALSVSRSRNPRVRRRVRIRIRSCGDIVYSLGAYLATLPRSDLLVVLFLVRGETGGLR